MSNRAQLSDYLIVNAFSGINRFYCGHNAANLCFYVPEMWLKRKKQKSYSGKRGARYFNRVTIKIAFKWRFGGFSA